MTTSLPISHERGPSLIVVFLLGICGLLNLYSPQPILLSLSHWSHISVETAGLTISTSTLGVALTAPFAGSISDRMGRKSLILGAILSMAVFSVCCAFSTSFYQLLFWRFMQGLSIPFVFAVTLAYISDECSDNTRALVNSVYVAGTACGGFLGRFIAGLTLDYTPDWRMTFYTLVIVEVIGFFFTLFLMQRERHFSPAPSLLSGITGIWEHLLDLRLVMTFCVGFFLLFQQVASFTYASIALQRMPYLLSPSEIGAIFLVFLFPIVTTPIAGGIIRRHGSLKAYRIFAILGAIGLVITLLGSTWSMVVGMAGSCTSIFAGQACATAFISNRCKTNKSSAIGLYLTAYYLGGAAGAIVPSSIYESLGWPGCVYLLLVTIIVGYILARLVWEERKGDATFGIPE